MNIQAVKLVLLIITSILTLNFAEGATVENTVTMTVPGSLHEIIGNDAKSLVKLKIVGDMNPDDIYYIRDEMVMLDSLDIYNASVIDNDYGNSLPEYGFYRSNIKNIILPKSLECIRFGCFEECANLKSIVIPETVGMIDLNVFANSSIAYVQVKNPNPVDISWCTFIGSFNTNGLLVVPLGSKQDYENSLYWSDFFSIEESDELNYLEPTIGNISYEVANDFVKISGAKTDNSEPIDIIIPETIQIQDKNLSVSTMGCGALIDVRINEIFIPKTLETIFVTDEPKWISEANGKILSKAPFMRAKRIVVEEGNKNYYVHDNCLYSNDKMLISGYVQAPDGKSVENFDVVKGTEVIVGWSVYGDYYNIVLPASIKNIGPYSLQPHRSVVCYATTPPIIFEQPTDYYGNIVFDLYVPAGSEDLYRNAPVWCDFSSIHTIEDSKVEFIFSESSSAGNWKIYDIKGSFINYVTDMEDMESLPPAIYIITDGNISYKFFKR